jgi:hypothetical protein
MNAQAARKARRSGVQPYLLTRPEEVEAMPPFPFPFLGDGCEDWDSEWEHLDDLFVDSSGLGTDEEPALTVDRFKEVLAGLIRKHGRVYAAIREAGGFQVWVALWADNNVGKTFDGS